MARVCQVCGKGTKHGSSRLHRHSKWRFRAPATKRTWKANLRTIKFTDPETNKNQEMKICMKCYKRYQKDGRKFLQAKAAV